MIDKQIRDGSQVLLVTGSGRGIEAATARLAGQRAYSVCVNYLREQREKEEVVNAVYRHWFAHKGRRPSRAKR